MSIALRCYECQEWLHQHARGWAICPCKKLKLSSTGGVRGLYTEFWNEEKDIHIIHENPRGM